MSAAKRAARRGFVETVLRQQEFLNYFSPKEAQGRRRRKFPQFLFLATKNTRWFFSEASFRARLWARRFGVGFFMVSREGAKGFVTDCRD
jgi:hypothetical protein